MDNNKILMFGGAAMVAYYFLMQKEPTTPGGNSATCPGNIFIVDGQRVCDDQLTEMGYIFWSDRASGPSGWYDIDSFVNAFSLAPVDFINALQSSSANSQLPVSDPLHTIAQQLLNIYLIDGETPLLIA